MYVFIWCNKSSVKGRVKIPEDSCLIASVTIGFRELSGYAKKKKKRKNRGFHEKMTDNCFSRPEV